MNPLGLFNLGRAAWPDLDRLLRPTDPAPAPAPPSTPYDRLCIEASRLGIYVLDLRGMSRTVHYETGKWGWFRDDNPKRNIPKRGRARGTLPWKKRTAIMLHRTGVSMGPRRFLGCPCHCGVANDATIVLCHPHDAYVMHGHHANRFSVGVEISSKDGRITELQRAATAILVRYIVEDLREHRGAMAPIVTMGHCQSHESRPDDPGAYIWQQVAIPAMDLHGMDVGPVVGSGIQIPHRWFIRLANGVVT
jgi:hypothetical protein